eukprot:GHUV01042340.1.p1 GENE.GHUV01042340.1~~GHUV01042340.1.p1  ORF type:complete len:114 (+),score=10.23 GHUV01042340.1:721-1062(+)
MHDGVRSFTVSCQESKLMFAPSGRPDKLLVPLQVLFNVVQQARPEVPPYSELPGLPGSQLPRWVLQSVFVRLDLALVLIESLCSVKYPVFASTVDVSSSGRCQLSACWLVADV